MFRILFKEKPKLVPRQGNTFKYTTSIQSSHIQKNKNKKKSITIIFFLLDRRRIWILTNSGTRKTKFDCIGEEGLILWICGGSLWRAIGEENSWPEEPVEPPVFLPDILSTRWESGSRIRPENRLSPSSAVPSSKRAHVASTAGCLLPWLLLLSRFNSHLNHKLRLTFVGFKKNSINKI